MTTLYHDLTEDQIAGCKRFCSRTWSDLHKDAHGYRPRFSLEGYTAAQLDTLWDQTIDALNDTMEQDDLREIEAELAFDARLNAMIALGAANRNVAFRWIVQADDMEDDLRHRDFGFMCYKLGLPYRFETELVELAR